MTHTLYSSIEDMVHPETLSTLLKKQVTTVRMATFEPTGSSYTGSRFQGLHINNEENPSLVIKRMSMERDWLMHTTEDRQHRSTTVWQHGILEQLPSEIYTSIIACSEDGTGRAILMHNVADKLLPVKTQLSEMENSTILNAMAAFHAAFWESPVLRNPDLGLCTLENLITYTSPEKCERLMSFMSKTDVLELILEGWHLLPSFYEPDVVLLIRRLMQHPNRLTDTLAFYPQTLIHGDLRPDNIGLSKSPYLSVIFLDFARLSCSVPTVDLAWYLATAYDELPVPPESVIELYRQHLQKHLGEHYDDFWWQSQLELGLLAGYLPLTCFLAYYANHSESAEGQARARKRFDWWSEQIRKAARRLPK